MVTKTDVLNLLNELEEKGENVDGYVKELYSSVYIPENVLTFLNDKRSFDVANFYERIRESYNKKRSDLYVNIVREVEDVESVLTTLASYNLQVLLYARKLEDKEMFYRNARAEEVTRVLNNYYKTFDLSPCLTVLALVKADIKLFEDIRKRKKQKNDRELS